MIYSAYKLNRVFCLEGHIFFNFLFCIGSIAQYNVNNVTVSGRRPRNAAWVYTCPFSLKPRPGPACHVMLSRVPSVVQEAEGPMLSDDGFAFHLLFFLVPYHGGHSLQDRVECL